MTSPPGCQGLYATIRWDARGLRWPERHLARLAASLQAWDRGLPDLDLPGLSAQVVHAQGLAAGVARVNWFVRFGASSAQDAWSVQARRHDPSDDGPVRLAVSAEARDPALARHKILHEASLLRARAAARDQGCDDAALPDRQGRLAETTTAALLFARQGRLFRSAATDRLPSTAEAVLADALGPDLALADIGPDASGEWSGAFEAWPHAFAVNALRGARPVRQIGHRMLAVDLDTADRLNRILLA